MAVPVSELQSINPTSIIELFVIELNPTLHGSNTIYRFHSGANMNANGQVIWAGNSYLRFPIECTGFEFGSRGTLPRPTITVSNILGTITAIMQDINTTTVGNDLNGAKFIRIRTLARFLDAANFPPIGGNPPENPFGTPDPDAEFPREIYTIDRKASENRDVVEFELAAAFDLVGVRAPKRQCTRKLFPSLGSFV